MIQINTENKVIIGDLREVKSETIDILYMIYNKVKQTEGRDAALGTLLDMMIKVTKKKTENMVWEPSLEEIMRYSD